MEANIITLGRIALIFVTIGLFQLHSVYVHAFAALMVAIVIYLDQLDGYVARKLNVASDFGALFDIVGDRIVESVLWIYFASMNMISFWAPMIVITRGFLADSVRAQAFKQGKTPLVSSRFSRGFYGAAKAFLFTFLGIIIVINSGIHQLQWQIPSNILGMIDFFKDFLVYLTTFMCLVRGLPVLWDGKEILFEKVYPRTIHVIDAEKSSNI